MFGGGREKQRQYSSVSTEEGHREGPEVRLNNFWPIVLMVFIGVMTFPTLIISAVTLARVPEAYDISSITASLDKDTKTTLKSATDAVTSATNNLGTHAAAVTNAASIINSHDKVVTVTANGKVATGDVNPSTVCDPTSSAASTTHIVTRYLIGKTAPGTTSTSTQVVMAKICPAKCDKATTTKVWLPPSAVVGVSNFETATELTLNKLTTPQEVVGRFSESVMSDANSNNDLTMYVTVTNLAKVTVSATSDDAYTVSSFSYKVSTTDALILNSPSIVYYPTYGSLISQYTPGVNPALLNSNNPLTDTHITNFQVVTDAYLTSNGISTPTGMDC